MIQSKGKIALAFVFSILLTLLSPLFFSKISINFLLAPIVMVMYRASYSSTLIIAFLSGLYLDCLWLSIRLGFVGLSFLLSMRLLYPCRLYFFSDTPSTLFFMTYLFSSLSTFVQSVLALFFEQASPLTNARWFLSDVCIMPLLDAGYGVIAFVFIPKMIHAFVLFVRNYRKKVRP